VLDSQKLVWINLEGAGWALLNPLMKAGQLPHMAKLLARATRGQPHAVPPSRYPTSVVSLATGAAPHDHKVVSALFAEEASESGARPFGRSDWAAPPVWDIAARAGLSVAALGWPGTYPAQSNSGAFVVSDAYLLVDGDDETGRAVDPMSVSDPSQIDSLRNLRLRPKDVTPAMVSPFLEAKETIDVANDERLRQLIEPLSRALTLHQTASAVMAARDWEFVAINFDFIDQISQYFLQYQAPRLGHVTNADHKRYKNVVNAAYVHFDQMLASYIQSVGADGNIVLTSDHGYLCGSLRKRPAEWAQGNAHLAYRDQGVFCAAGPAFRAENTIPGFTAPMVAPTLLAALGIAAPDGMKSGIMASVLAKPDLSRRAAPSVAEVSRQRVPAHLEKRMLSYLNRRGVIAPLPEAREAAMELAEVTRLIRLAEYNIGAKSYATALAHLETARAMAPSSIQVHVMIAQCCANSQNWAGAAAALEVLEKLNADLPMATFLRGRVALAKGDSAVARTQFAAAISEVEDTMEGCRLLEAIGFSYVRLNALQEAADAFAQALRINKAAPKALSGLAGIYLALKDDAKALASCNLALKALHMQPRTHALRGHALLGLGQHDDARQAFETALRLSPDMDIARKGLNRLEKITTQAAFAVLNAGQDG